MVGGGIQSTEYIVGDSIFCVVKDSKNVESEELD